MCIRDSRINNTIMKELGFDTQADSVDFSEVIGTELKVILNDDYYITTEYGTYTFNTDYKAMYESENSITLSISGIIRPKEDSPASMSADGGALGYSDALAQRVIDNSVNSEIVKAQEKSDVNVLSMESLDDETKKQTLAYLGGNATPCLLYTSSE